MNKMPATVDHNYPKNGNMLAVPERGTVTITILDNTGKSVGITQANKDGTWQRSFRLQDGKYTVKFTGIFRPLGTTPDGQLVSQPVKSDQRQIAITSPPTPPPQGATGASGPSGPSGPQGPQGESGPLGPKGPEGESGPQGRTGLPGTAGAEGQTGVSGPSGAEGQTGPSGPSGSQGPQGNEGATGPQGATGASAPDPWMTVATSSDNQEDFSSEGYRMNDLLDITSLNYASGPNNGPTGPPAPGDGLLVSAGQLSYPSGPSGNRTWIRYFINSDITFQNFVFDFTATDTTFVNVSAGPSGNNVTAEFLAPNTTIWKDMTLGAYVNGPGSYAGTLGATIPTDWGISLLTDSTDTSANAWVLRLTASDQWAGSIDNIRCILRYIP